MRMKRRTKKQVNEFINGLTANEDFRQDLWVNYLTYNNLDTLKTRARQLELEEMLCEKSIDLINEFGAQNVFTKYPDLVNNFTQFEQTVIFLLLVGFSVQDISDYKNISIIRVKQAIHTIKQSKIWDSIRKKYS